MKEREPYDLAFGALIFARNAFDNGSPEWHRVDEAIAILQETRKKVIEKDRKAEETRQRNAAKRAAAEALKKRKMEKD